MKKHVDHEFIIALRNLNVIENRKLVGAKLEKCKPKILYELSRLGGRTSICKDIFQEGVLAIHKKAQDETFTLKYSFHSYLLGICRRKFFDLFRKKITLVDLNERSDHPTSKSFEDLLIETETKFIEHQKIKTTFEKISTRCQEIFRRMAKGEKIPDIANVLGITRNAIDRRIHGCRKRMKTLLKNL